MPDHIPCMANEKHYKENTNDLIAWPLNDMMAHMIAMASTDHLVQEGGVPGFWTPLPPITFLPARSWKLLHGAYVTWR